MTNVESHAATRCLFVSIVISVLTHFLVLYCINRPQPPHAPRDSPGSNGSITTVTFSSPGRGTNSRPELPDTRKSDHPSPAPSSSGKENKVEIPPLDGKNYFSLKDLDRPPRALADPMTLLPSHLPDSTLGHRMALRLWIDEQGRVTHAILLETELDPATAKMVTSAFEKAHFRPGEIGGFPVKAMVNIEIRNLPVPP